MNFRDNPFNLPIRIHYRPPNSLVYFLTVSHVGALLCLFPTAFSVWWKAMLAGLLALNYIYYFPGLLRARIQEPRPQLCLNRENEWSLVNTANDALALTLHTGALVHRLLLVLRFTATDGQTYSFILTPKNVDLNTLRHLRARLLHGNKEPERC